MYYILFNIVQNEAPFSTGLMKEEREGKSFTHPSFIDKNHICSKFWIQSTLTKTHGVNSSVFWLTSIEVHEGSRDLSCL